MRNFTKREDELKTHMDKWLFPLRNLGQLTRRPKALQERIFKKIFSIAKISAMDTKEYTAYQQSLKAYWDLSSSIQSSFELGVEQGMEQGIEQGMEKGREKGLEEGRDEGIQIGVAQAKADLIRKLHKSGMSTHEIASITELSKAEIRKMVGP